jgi:hypothetical protein
MLTTPFPSPSQFPFGNTVLLKEAFSEGGKTFEAGRLALVLAEFADGPVRIGIFTADGTQQYTVSRDKVVPRQFMLAN